MGDRFVGFLRIFVVFFHHLVPADEDEPFAAVLQLVVGGGIYDFNDGTCKREPDATGFIKYELFEKIGLEDVRRIYAHHGRRLGRTVALVDRDAEFYLKFLFHALAKLFGSGDRKAQI